MRNVLRAAAVAAFVLSFGVSQAAHAITISFTTHESGRNLGTAQLATLEAMQMGNDVQFTLTNTLTAQPVSKLTQLLLGYSGDLAALQSMSLMNVSGVASDGFKVGVTNGKNPKLKPINNAGNDFDIDISFPTSGTLINPGDTSTFKLTNTLLSNFFLGSGREPFAQIHMQALRGSGGTSTKYSGSVVTTPPAIPLPASLPLLMGALAGLGLIGRRRKAA